MSKFFNESKHGAYSPIPELSPYGKINKSRLENPKFIYRYTCKKLKEYLVESKKDRNWLDIGCANGEFIHYMVSQQISFSKIVGIDITQEFIDVAKTLLSIHSNVELKCIDFLKENQLLDKGYDVITCLGTIQIFPDPSDFINLMINKLKPGGILILDGRINKSDISAIIKFIDNSKSAKGLWRCDFNVHSENQLREILANHKKIKKFKFDYQYIDTEIAKVDGAPHINAWTIKDDEGNYRIVNGTMGIVDPSFLIVMC